jgi:hypothetical protein
MQLERTRLSFTLTHGCQLRQVEGTEQLQSAFTSAAPGLGMTADTITQLFDKSLPTMIGMWMLNIACCQPPAIGPPAVCKRSPVTAGRFAVADAVELL